MKELTGKDLSETKGFTLEGYKNIRPETDITLKEVTDFWKDVFETVSDLADTMGEAVQEEIEDIDQLVGEYINDMKEKSEYPETIGRQPFKVSDLKRITPEENKAMREEFNKKKSELKAAWEEKYGRPWPKYEEYVYSKNGIAIREPGQDYDVHHKHPLSLGGKNEVDNITPMHADNHYDHQGVHAPDSPYAKLIAKFGG